MLIDHHRSGGLRSRTSPATHRGVQAGRSGLAGPDDRLAPAPASAALLAPGHGP